MAGDRMLALMDDLVTHVTVEDDDDDDDQCIGMKPAYKGRVHIAARRASAIRMVKQECANPRAFVVFADASSLPSTPTTPAASGAGIAHPCIEDGASWVEVSVPLPAVESSLAAELAAAGRALGVARAELLHVRHDFGTDMIVTVLSDCKSALEWIARLRNATSLATLSADLRPLIQDIQDRARLLNDLGAEVDFMWVPSHDGVYGNERADALARAAATTALKILAGNHPP